MCLAGMNVARLNFFSWLSRGASKENRFDPAGPGEAGAPIAIMLDTKGPEYRIKPLQISGSPFTMGICLPLPPTMVEIRPGFVTYKGLIEDLEVGDTIMVNNGLVIFRVEQLRAAMPGAGSWQGAICLTGRV